MKRELHTWTYRVIACLVAILMVAGTGGCQKGKTGPRGLAGQPGTPGEPGLPGEPAPLDTTLAMFEDLPGIVLTVTDVTGGTGLAGQFQPGDTISVRFTLETGDGRALGVKDLDVTNIWFTGPTSNYQRVIPNDGGFFLTDVKDTATINMDGSYTYQFTLPIPATYGPPLNDSPYTTVDELTGQALLSGTYTISMAFGKEYYVGSDLNLDVANHAEDVLVGSETVITPREVVGADNCAACHVQIRHHELEEGNNATMMFRDPRICVTCHTSGAEDDDQKASIDFRVMIHKIHNGTHLPSVNGVTTNPDGSRKYDGTITPYLVGDKDYSYVNFPVWPSFNVGMPKDYGYASLSSSVPSITNAGGVALKGAQALEGQILKGVVSCEKCHGDGGDGSVTPPAQGDLAFYEPSRRACGACHDDVRWDDPGKPGAVSYPVAVNQQVMGAQDNDHGCIDCHSATFNAAALPNSSIATRNAHLHPLLNMRAKTANYFNPEIVLNVTNVAEAGTNNDDGTIDPGEKVAITFTVKDTAGNNVAIDTNNVLFNWRSAISVILSGPTTNLNQINYAALPVPALVGLSSPYTVNMPEPVALDYTGDSTASATDVMTTSRKPIWNVAAGANATAVALSGLAQAGGASTIKFCQTAITTPPLTNCPAAASKTDDTYNNQWVWITSGTGAGQSRMIVGYAGSTYTATVYPSWGTAPDATSYYAVGASVVPWVFVRQADFSPTTPAAVLAAATAAKEPFLDVDISGQMLTGTATAAANQSITLDGSASTTVDYYKNFTIVITGGTGKGQTNVISGYTAGRVASVWTKWTTNPDTTSTYRVQPFGTADIVVVDDGVGGKEEYLKITASIVPAPGQTSNAIQRLILGTTYTTSATNATRFVRFAHDAGASVKKANFGVNANGVTATPKRYGQDYTVDSANGTITEVGDSFGTGNAVLVGYTTDFVMPTVYPPPFYDSPNLSSDNIETWGAWKNKSIVSGTYMLGMWTAMTEVLVQWGEQTSFTEASPPQDYLVKVGSATSLTAYDKIESSISEDSKLVAGETCNACHNTIRFHGGGRRDFATCIMCHGTAGIQAGPQNVPSENVNFRFFLHEFHRPSFWPQPTLVSDTNDESEPEVFPAMPGGAATCTKCHGDATAWQEPPSRDHPTQQVAPTRVYRASCAACHEESAAEAHMEIQTSAEGVESCAVCHGDGAEFDVKLVHKHQ